MTVQEAIDKIYAPKGLTSVIAGILNDDLSVLNNQKGIETSLSKVDKMISKYQQQMEECQSDWAYWSILSDLEYWKAVKNILTAGALNNGVVADVSAPNLENTVVMDAISQITAFGEMILLKTKRMLSA